MTINQLAPPPAEAQNGTELTVAISHQLVAITGDRRLWVRNPDLADLDWNPFDEANDVTGLAYLFGPSVGDHDRQ